VPGPVVRRLTAARSGFPDINRAENGLHPAHPVANARLHYVLLGFCLCAGDLQPTIGALKFQLSIALLCLQSRLSLPAAWS